MSDEGTGAAGTGAAEGRTAGARTAGGATAGEGTAGAGSLRAGTAGADPGTAVRGPTVGLRTAWRFLTRVPWRGATGDLAGAAGWLPVVGAALGAAAGGVYALAAPLVGRLPAAACALLGLLAATGALHWDGLADAADGLAAGGGPERAVAAMRDPRAGAAAALTVSAVGLLFAATLAGLPPARAWRALLAAGAVGRWVMVTAAARWPYPEVASGLGASVARRVPGRALLGATLAAGAAALALGWTGAVALAAAAAAAEIAARALAARLGGLTGDAYGALEVVSEVAVLLVAVGAAGAVGAMGAAGTMAAARAASAGGSPG